MSSHDRRPIPPEWVAPPVEPNVVSGGDVSCVGDDGERQRMWYWARSLGPRHTGLATTAKQACEALLDVLEDGDATPEQIEDKVLQLRALRQKAREQLRDAEARLREALTLEQEAILVFRGYLD